MCQVCSSWSQHDQQAISGPLGWENKFINRTAEMHSLLHSGLLPSAQVCRQRGQPPQEGVCEGFASEGAIMLREAASSGSHSDSELGSLPFWSHCQASAPTCSVMQLFGGGGCWRGRVGKCRNHRTFSLHTGLFGGRNQLLYLS